MGPITLWCILWSFTTAHKIPPPMIFHSQPKFEPKLNKKRPAKQNNFTFHETNIFKCPYLHISNIKSFLDLKRHKKLLSALYWGVIILHFIINVLHYRTCYLVTLVQSYRIICKFEFQNIFGKLRQICLKSYNPFLTSHKRYRL